MEVKETKNAKCVSEAIGVPSVGWRGREQYEVVVPNLA